MFGARSEGKLFFSFQDVTVGDDWTSERWWPGLAWVCVTGPKGGKTVAKPMKCQNMVISGKCVENLKPFGPDFAPDIEVCKAA